jgi:hypothetical protein
MRLVDPYLDGGSLYCHSPPHAVILSVLRGVGMASDQTNVTAIPSVLAGSVWRAYPCQSRRARLGLTSFYSS